MATNLTIEQMVEDWTPKLQRAFLDAIYAMRDRVQVGLVAEMLEKGDIDGAIRAVGPDPVSLRDFDRTIAEAFEDGGKAATGNVPALREPSGHVLKIQFDARAPRAEMWLREHSVQRVAEIITDQRNTIRTHLVAGMATGENPRKVALDLAGRINRATGKREGGVIGLASPQEAWVRSYVDRLQSGNPAEMRAALEMNLRDKRFDAAVLRAIRDEKPIPPATLEKMAAAYRTRALRYRAETIGRTEAMTSLSEGREQGWRQALDAGQVRADQIIKTWKTAKDERVRSTHRALDGKIVGFDEVFVSPSGSRLRYPGDLQAPAREIVMCRCTASYRLDYTGKIKRGE